MPSTQSLLLNAYPGQSSIGMAFAQLAKRRFLSIFSQCSMKTCQSLGNQRKIFLKLWAIALPKLRGEKLQGEQIFWLMPISRLKLK
jgi:hypothetical protein